MHPNYAMVLDYGIATIQRNMIVAKILSGSAQSQVICIPKNPMITNKYPFEFKWVQYSMKLCLAMYNNNFSVL